MFCCNRYVAYHDAKNDNDEWVCMPRDSIDENDLFFGVLDAMCQRDEYLQQTVREDLAM